MSMNHSGGPSVLEYNRGSYDTYPNQPSYPQRHPSNENFRRSDYSGSGKNDRFDQYKKKNFYKYNLFSMIDEPWNRCCEFGKCGSCCPANECIAKKEPRLDWL